VRRHRRRFKRLISSSSNPRQLRRTRNVDTFAFKHQRTHRASGALLLMTVVWVSHSALICAAARRRRPPSISLLARPRVTPRPEDRRPDRQMMAAASEHRLPTCLRLALGELCSMPTSWSMFVHG